MSYLYWGSKIHRWIIVTKKNVNSPGRRYRQSILTTIFLRLQKITSNKNIRNAHMFVKYTALFDEYLIILYADWHFSYLWWVV